MQPGAGFRETRWTQIRKAQDASAEGRQALSDLCAAYYEPITAFLQRSLPDRDSAREVSHAFFARLLAGGAITQANEDRGRFRSYLLGALKHFIARQREAETRLKRGASVEHLSADAPTNELPPLALPDTGQLSPDEAYDRQWALTVLDRAMESLRRECFDEGRGGFFEEAKPWLTGEAGHGEQKEWARRSGMNETALKVAIHRLRRRFRHLLRDEVAATLEHPESVDQEMQALFAALENKRSISGNPSPVPRQETEA
jgi:RNA polymerase sigma-70 factor (ECF subfamily)